MLNRFKRLHVCDRSRADGVVTKIVTESSRIELSNSLDHHGCPEFFTIWQHMFVWPSHEFCISRSTASSHRPNGPVVHSRHRLIWLFSQPICLATVWLSLACATSPFSFQKMTLQVRLCPSSCLWHNGRSSTLQEPPTIPLPRFPV